MSEPGKFGGTSSTPEASSSYRLFICLSTRLSMFLYGYVKGQEGGKGGECEATTGKRNTKLKDSFCWASCSFG